MNLDLCKIPANYVLKTYQNIDSTNSEAKRIAKSLLVENRDGVVDSGFRDVDRAIGKTLIVTEEQSAGYGQRGRVWQSTKGNLFLSILLPTSKPLVRLQELVFMTAVVMAKYIEDLAQTKSIVNSQTFNSNSPAFFVSLKWPNDILVNDSKVAGILFETIKIGNQQFVIIGIGINLNQAHKIEGRAITSLKKEWGSEVLLEEFLSGFMSKFDAEYNIWESIKDKAITKVIQEQGEKCGKKQDEQDQGSFKRILKEWQDRAYNLHKEIAIDTGAQSISGVFCGLRNNGAIIIKKDSGEEVAIEYGEIY